MNESRGRATPVLRDPVPESRVTVQGPVPSVASGASLLYPEPGGSSIFMSRSGEADAQRAPGPEEEALEALERRDYEAALTVLMSAYGGPLYRYCRHMMGDDARAEDVHQMTFVQAYQALPGFVHRSTLRTWLYGIARHRCLDALKVGRRRQARFKLVGDLPESADPAAGAEERLAARDRSRLLARCLRVLAPKARSAVLLRYQEGLSYPEMAALSRERAPTLQARVARALPALRRCLEAAGVRL